MRTTLAIDDDVLSAAKELAQTGGRTIGEVLSDLARRSLQPDTEHLRTRNGIPLLPVRKNAKPVTSEHVRHLLDELE